MKFLSQLTTMVSGSINGLVGSHNRGGQYFRARVVPTDPGTSYQTNVRASFGALVTRWRETLTDVQRAGWTTYGQNVTRVDRLGQAIHLTGQQEYIRANLPRLASIAYSTAGYAEIAAIAVIDAPPTIYDSGTMPVVSFSNLTVDAGPPLEAQIDVTPQTLTAGDTKLLYAGRPQDPTVSYYKGPYTLIQAAAGNVPSGGGDLADVLDSPYVLKWATPTIGQRVFYMVRWSMADGRLSDPVRGFVTAEAP